MNDLAVQAAEGAPLTIDLVTCQISTPGGDVISFEVDATRRKALLEGLDDISTTLRDRGDIIAWQVRDRAARPWIWQ